MQLGAFGRLDTIAEMFGKHLLGPFLWQFGEVLKPASSSMLSNFNLVIHLLHLLVRVSVFIAHLVCLIRIGHHLVVHQEGLGL